MAVSTIHCYTVLAYIESGVLSYRLLVYGGEHNTLLHRVSLYRELRALLQAFSVWR